MMAVEDRNQEQRKHDVPPSNARPCYIEQVQTMSPSSSNDPTPEICWATVPDLAAIGQSVGCSNPTDPSLRVRFIGRVRLFAVGVAANGIWRGRRLTQDRAGQRLAGRP